MLARRCRLVWLPQIIAWITQAFNNPSDVSVTVSVIMTGCLAQKVSRRRHARGRADAHVEPTVEEELLDLWSRTIDPNWRNVVVAGTTCDQVYERLDHKR